MHASGGGIHTANHRWKHGVDTRNWGRSSSGGPSDARFFGSAAGMNHEMTNGSAPFQLLRTTAGEFPLHEYHLQVGEREWTIQHTGVILTHDDERQYLGESTGSRLPYGVALWPASIALAHELATRSETLAGSTVLELGAGTGLPGIVAAALGAQVVQTDRHELALSVCRRNGERNGITGIE